MGGGLCVGFMAAGGECEAEINIILTGESLAAEDEVAANEAG